MAYEVITQGGGEGLVYTFNAIAALFNGPRGFVGSLVYIGGSFATAIMVMTLVIKQELLPSAKWFFGSLIMMTALMLPKVNILIKDRITHLQAPVANVPFVLGAFAGIASQLGDIMAEKFDTLFSRTGGEVMNYRTHGVAMASQLAAKANSFTIPNPDAAANLKGFVQNCMVFDIAKGKYSIDELLSARDTWLFLKEQASPIRGFPYRVAKHNSQILTCKQAAIEIEKTWRKNLLEAANRYGSDLFPHRPRGKSAAAVLLSNLGLSYQYLTGLSLDAALILRQNLMRQTIEEGLLELNQFHDSSAAVTAYAVARAQAQQKTAYALQGKMASLSLSTLKIVVEVLFYGIFPIIVAIAVFPGGLGIVKKYLIALFWIQSWAPMYSILNMLVNVYGKAKSVAAVTLPDGTTKALAFSTIHRLGEANDWVSAVAGYAMMSVPFLSYGIIHYGAGALSQLATHFGSITQSSASHASEEATTGNYQMGNTSFDNHNRSNTTAFKYDTNASVLAGKQTVQQADGGVLHHMPDGQTAYDMSPALPKLNSQIKISDSLATSLNETAGESIQSARLESQSAVKNTTAAFNQLNEFRKSRAKDTSSSDSYSQQESALEETAFGKYDDLVNRFADEHKLDKSAAVAVFAEVSASYSTPGIFGASIGGKAGISYTGKSTDSNTFSKAQDYSEKHGMNELLKQARQEAKEGKLSFLNTEHVQYGDIINSSLNKADSQIETAQASLNEAEYYQSQANYVSQNGLSIDQDLTKHYWDFLVQTYGVEQAKELVSNPTANIEHMKRFSQAKKNELMQQFKLKSPTDKASVKQEYQVEKEQITDLQDIEGTANTSKKTVLIERNKANLCQPIDTSLMENVNTRLDTVNHDLEQRGQAIEREKAEQIKKVEKDPQKQKVYTNEIDPWTIVD